MKSKNLKKVLSFLFLVTTMAVMLSLTCFAAPTDFTNTDVAKNIAAALNSVRSWILIISSPICGIAAIVCFIRMMITTDPKAHETMKSWLIRIVIAWVGINGLALILNMATSMVGVSGAYT